MDLKRSVSSSSSSTETEDTELISKRRKVVLYSVHEGEYSDGGAISAAESGTGGNEKNGAVKENSMRSPDLENFGSDVFEKEISTSGKGFSRETTPTNELIDEDSKHGLMMNLLATPRKKKTLPSTDRIRSIPTGKRPPEIELNKLFAAVEKSEQKRFAEKYNFDIVKEVPLEGKYQWVRLHL